MISKEAILLFQRDMQNDPPDMSYSKEIVEPLVDEIIWLKRQLYGMADPHQGGTASCATKGPTE